MSNNKNYCFTEIYFKNNVKEAFRRGKGKGIKQAIDLLFLFRKKRREWYKKHQPRHKLRRGNDKVREVTRSNEKLREDEWVNEVKDALGITGTDKDMKPRPKTTGNGQVSLVPGINSG